MDTEGSSGLSSSASSSVMSLITKDVVDWKEGPKQCTGEEAFELPGDNRSGVSWADAGRENKRWIGELTANHVGRFSPNTTECKSKHSPELPPEPTSPPWLCWETALSEPGGKARAQPPAETKLITTLPDSAATIFAIWLRR